MNMEDAAKDRSGPKEARAIPGMERAQYEVLGVWGRKNTGPMENASMLAVKIQWFGTWCKLTETIQAAKTPTTAFGVRYRATFRGDACFCCRKKVMA